jgi:hypothetical protein
MELEGLRPHKFTIKSVFTGFDTKTAEWTCSNSNIEKHPLKFTNLNFNPTENKFVGIGLEKIKEFSLTSDVAISDTGLVGSKFNLVKTYTEDATSQTCGLTLQSAIGRAGVDELVLSGTCGGTDEIKCKPTDQKLFNVPTPIKIKDVFDSFTDKDVEWDCEAADEYTTTYENLNVGFDDKFWGKGKDGLLEFTVASDQPLVTANAKFDGDFNLVKTFKDGSKKTCAMKFKNRVVPGKDEMIIEGTCGDDGVKNLCVLKGQTYLHDEMNKRKIWAVIDDQKIFGFINITTSDRISFIKG